MSITEGARGTGGNLGVLAARRVIQMRDGLAELEPDAAKLTLLLRKMKKKSVKGPEYKWSEHDRFPHTVQANGTFSNVDTTITVDDGTVAADNQLVVVQRTGEVMRVTSKSGNDWTVTRSIGGTAAAAGLDNDYFTILATAEAENSAAPTARANPQTQDSNYTQIQRDTFGATGTAIQTELYGSVGGLMSQEARQRITDHQVGQETSFFFGEKSENTSGDYPLRTCGGLDEFITQTHDFGGAFSMQNAFDAMEVGMRYGANKKALFGSRSVISNISLEAMDKVRVAPSDKTFGIAIQVLESPLGQLMLMTHNLLDGGDYAKRAYLLDLAALQYVFLRKRDTALYEGLESNGVDGEIHGYLTEFGLERREAKKHQVWQNVSNG